MLALCRVPAPTAGRFCRPDENCGRCRGPHAPFQASCGGGAVSSDPWGRVDERGLYTCVRPTASRSSDRGRRARPTRPSPTSSASTTVWSWRSASWSAGCKTTDLSAKDAATAIGHLREQVDAHHAVGDLDALRARLDKLDATVDERREERKARKAQQSEEARGAKEQLVAEAEELARSDQWRAAGERLRALVDTWKGLPRLDRKTDDELWHRFSPRAVRLLQAPQGPLRAAGRAARGGQAAQGEAGGRGRVAVRVARTGGRRRPSTAS